MISSVPPLHRRAHDARTNLSSNELLHPDLASLLQAGLSAFEASRLGRYPDFDAGARALARLLGATEEAFQLVPGTDAAIRLIVRHLVATPNPPALLLQYPNYYAWEQAAASAGGRLVPIGWRHPEEQGTTILAAARSHRSELVAISFPNGPIGGGMTLEDVDRLAEVCAERGHTLLVDLCYAAFDRTLPPFLRRWGPHVVAIQSLSKSFGLAGLRIGVVAGDPGLIARLADERLEHCVSAPALVFAQYMARQRPALEAIWDDIARDRDTLAEALAAVGFAPIRSGGNFITFRAGGPTRAARITEEMSKRGFRVKSFEGVAGFEDCLRMTVAHAALGERALAALCDAARVVTNRG